MAKKSKAPHQKQAAPSALFAEALREVLDDFIADHVKTAAVADQSKSVLPGYVTAAVDYVLEGKKTKAYRDGLIIQIGWGLRTEEEFDHTLRYEGLRSVSDKLGPMFRERHIEAVVSAYQNIGKNYDVLARGNVLPFDEVLKWANDASGVERQAVFNYLLAKVALSARPVLPMPNLDRAKLTFHSCAVLIDELLAIPSGGAYQQYAVAAFLYAIIEEFGQGGVRGLRVDTKNINASDASSRVAGDVQVLRGKRVEEAFEVTANDWKTKIPIAVRAAKGADLQRIHILADVPTEFAKDLEALAGLDVDLTVIDVGSYLRTLLAVMRKPARAAALTRLYELLDRHLTDLERTNEYVRLLESRGLTAMD